ncbi:MAG: integral rane protein, partial [Modestobacter sp.]|nr:integral rane protein [Modestobacter sp.]
FPSNGFFTPAIFILIFPLGFRLTCYYYRKAYYRAFWQSPPACAVAEPHQKYSGETKLPLVGNNIHRYFFYAGLVFNTILTYDAIAAFFFEKNGGTHFGVGLGTFVLLANAAMLWLYSLSCHSCRHIMGGRLNHFSKHPLRYKFWTLVSKLNHSHMKFAWISLVGVALTDAYVWAVSSGLFNDPRWIS